MYKLPQLKFTTDGLAGVIGSETVNLHYGKHHQAYLDKLNSSLSDYPDFQNLEIEELLRQVNSLPVDLQTSVTNNGGGYYNHNLYWSFLTDNLDQQLTGPLYGDLESKYGSFDQFKEEFTNKAVSVFGSGWAWLMPNLEIVTTAGQENPIIKGQPVPILGIDVWEHAYYLDYQNRRPEYIEKWWRAVDWASISQAYKQSL